MPKNVGHNAIRTVLVAGALAATFSPAPALAQTASGGGGAPSADAAHDRGGRRGEFAGMQHVLGEVTAVNGAQITVKAQEGGTVEVVTTENTRLREDRGPIKVSDLRPGDGLMAIGNRDPNAPVLHAAMIFAQTAAEIKAMRDNLGKTYITGRVTAVNLDDARITVERADHVSQTIGFDETTSFKRAVRGGSGNGGPGGSGNGGEGGGEPGGGGAPPDSGAETSARGGFGGGMGMGGMALGGGIDRAFNNGESITLADIKVGDNVAGTGSVKNGTFVPTRLVDSRPRPHRPPSAAPGSNTPAPAGAPER